MPRPPGRQNDTLHRHADPVPARHAKPGGEGYELRNLGILVAGTRRLSALTQGGVHLVTIDMRTGCIVRALPPEHLGPIWPENAAEACFSPGRTGTKPFKRCDAPRSNALFKAVRNGRWTNQNDIGTLPNGSDRRRGASRSRADYRDLGSLIAA